MEHIPIDGSSHLASMGYDETNRVLEVRFHNGAVYQHPDVSETEFEAILANKSRGSAYARLIRAKKPGKRIA